MFLDGSQNGMPANGVSVATAPIGPTVARLCMALSDQDVFYIAGDEQRAEDIAAAAAAMCNAEVIFFQPDDILPGDPAPVSPRVAGLRHAALSAFATPALMRRLIVTTAAAASLRIPEPETVAAEALRLQVGDPIDMDQFADRLGDMGYFIDDRIDEAGEFAIWGSTIDIFPADAEMPLRLRIDGGRLTAIESYDALTQTGTGVSVETAMIVPARDFAPSLASTTLLACVPDAALAIEPDAARQRAWYLGQVARASDRADLLVDDACWTRDVADRVIIELTEQPGERRGEKFVTLRRGSNRLSQTLVDARARGDTIVLCGSARDLRFLLPRIDIGDVDLEIIGDWTGVTSATGRLFAIEVELDNGWSAPGLLVIAAADVLGARAGAGKLAANATPFEPASVMRVGDAVVHEDFGLGVVTGIEAVGADGIVQDSIRLCYAGDAQRLVPAADANRLWRYGGDADRLTLDKLDGSSWKKRRAGLDSAIAETADQLIALAKERSARPAPVLAPPVDAYERFTSTFAYRETADQTRAIAAVRDDLSSGHSMDRLIVGDVGYGKTEVALRAAALAALAGKQVAIIAPTTVLVRQHIETFRNRFSRLNIEVDGLSRLSTVAEARSVRDRLADGRLKIVIGTTALAAKDVRFDDLGLLIIDEEQRFGTKDKAKLRALVGDGHCLSMSATPIPRTLQAALVGLQDLSIIASAPSRRVPTRTTIGAATRELVSGALEREKRRGGQSFVVVPQIEDIERVAAHLQQWVPGFRVHVAHGKIGAADIDAAMVAFGSGDGDVLLATNIIEAGLDIPRANTMIIWRADRFGLAQLHQLRGRVGRGRTRGQMLLLTEGNEEIAASTMKRLRAIEALDQLGAGFAVSAHDMDTRGAGDLLGEDQAGHVTLIGTDLYQHLLTNAIKTARGETVAGSPCDISAMADAYFPDSWIADGDTRITHYVRLARSEDMDAIEALQDEMEDRFGDAPAPALSLFALADIRIMARDLGIARIQAGPKAIALTLPDDVRPKFDTTMLDRKGKRWIATGHGDDAGFGPLKTLLKKLEATVP